MYTLDSGYGITYSDKIGWQDIAAGDLNDVPLNVIANLYRKLYLTISAPILDDPIHIDYDIFRYQNINNTTTLAVFLDELPNDTLPALGEIPRYETKTVMYEDAFRAGYKIKIAGSLSNPSNILAPEDKTEIIITRPSTDMRRFYDYCLVSVNGYFHMTDTDNVNVYVIDGGRSLNKSRMNNLGLVSFENIGKVHQYKITEEMIYKAEDEAFMSQRVYFDLSEIDTTDKTVFAVVGGYLYSPFNDTFKQFGEHSWRIDFNGVPLLDRYFDSLKYLDMSHLGLTEYPNNSEQISTTEFYTDEVFTNYLTGPQSFIVVVDNPLMYESKHFIKHTRLPGMFTTYSDPKYPLFTANGKVREYWKIEEDGHWSVNVHEAWWHHRVASTINSAQLKTMDSSSVPYKPFYASKGYLLELGADSLITP